MPLINDPKPFDQSNDKWDEITIDYKSLTADQQAYKQARLAVTGWFNQRRLDGRLGNYQLDEIYSSIKNLPAVEYYVDFSNKALEQHRLYIIKSFINDNIKAFIDMKDVQL